MSLLKRLFGPRPPKKTPMEILEPRWDELERLRVAAFGLFPTNDVGFSQLCGQPFAPKDFVWPRHHGAPLSLLAQLDLSTIKDERLPESGYLYFFYDRVNEPWGCEIEDRGSWAVKYESGDAAEFIRHEWPVGLDDNHPGLAIELAPIRIYPDLQSEVADSLKLGEDEFEPYIDLQQSVFGKRPMHQLMGVPALIQCDDMEEECHHVTTGYPIAEREPKHPNYAKHKQEASEWKLLLQLDGDPSFDFLWSDSGMIYFWIKEGDLATRNFDNVWLILQSH